MEEKHADEEKKQEETKISTEEAKKEEKLPIKAPIPATESDEKISRYLLFFVYNSQAPIIREDIFDLVDQLNKIPTPPEETRIDMVILSNGGFPHPAYQMMDVVRSKCKKLKAIYTSVR
jgi:hypothetical protein